MRRALVHLAMEDDVVLQLTNPAAKAEGLALLAKQLADQLWIEGYELGLVGRTESMELLAGGELLYEYD